MVLNVWVQMKIRNYAMKHIFQLPTVIVLAKLLVRIVT